MDKFLGPQHKTYNLQLSCNSIALSWRHLLILVQLNKQNPIARKGMHLVAASFAFVVRSFDVLSPSFDVLSLSFVKQGGTGYNPPR